jgi:hypothetical protein
MSASISTAKSPTPESALRRSRATTANSCCRRPNPSPPRRADAARRAPHPGQRAGRQRLSPRQLRICRRLDEAGERRDRGGAATFSALGYRARRNKRKVFRGCPFHPVASPHMGPQSRSDRDDKIGGDGRERPADPSRRYRIWIELFLSNGARCALSRRPSPKLAPGRRAARRADIARATVRSDPAPAPRGAASRGHAAFRARAGRYRPRRCG